MRKFLLGISALMLMSIVSLHAASQSGQEQKVIVGKYVSAQDGKIKVEGNDGNIYLLDIKNIDSSVIIRDGYDQAYVKSSNGIKELKIGSTVVLNVNGIVMVEVKENK